MKKNLFLPALITLLIITISVFIDDGMVYLVTGLMAFAVIAAIRGNKPWVNKITRWAKANPKKTQLFIAIMQLLLLFIGVVSGYNYYKLGIEFSNTTIFVFGALSVAGFLSVHFFPKRKTIAIPAEVNRMRLIFIIITISSFAMSVFTGNKINDKYPDSIVANTLESIDQAIFNETDAMKDAVGEYENNIQTLAFASFASHPSETVEPPVTSKKEARDKIKAEKKAKKLEKRKAKMIKRLERMAFGAGTTAGVVLLVILLGITLCAGICMIIGGFSGNAWLIPLGALVAGGSIWGIISVLRSQKTKSPEK